MTLQVYRDASVNYSFEVDEQTFLTEQMMGEHKVVADFIAHAKLDVQIGDYIEVGSEKFYINLPPQVQKINNFTFKYSITFEGERYSLYDKILMDEGADEFNYYGAPEDFLQLIVDNMNSISSGWSIDQVDEDDAQNIQFQSNTSCRSALTQIADAFQMEFKFVGRAISMVKVVGNETTLKFQYGRGKGLYTLIRQAIEDKNIVTRVYGFGSDKNLISDYRNNSKRLVFESRYLENNTDLYGIKEGSFTDDTIYPHRTGTVSSVNADDALQISDEDLDFNLTEYILENLDAQIVFKSGSLEGYTFDVAYYDEATNTIHFKEFIDSNNYTLPNDDFKPSVGDQYTIVGIRMPQSYIDAAEAELQTKTQQYLLQNSVPSVTYALQVDERYIRKNNINIAVGDKITVVDDDLGVNSMIRVSAISFPLVNPAAITATISDTISYTVQEKLIAKTVTNEKVIKEVDRTNIERARLNTQRVRDLQNLVFDPDGYFDPTHIKPASIETGMLSVGVKSQNFYLDGVTIQPNYNGDANDLEMSGGQLKHAELEIEGLGYVWQMDQASFTGLNPGNSYYVYAKVSKTALTGTWQCDTAQHTTEEETGYWWLWLGILSAVNSGVRGFTFTNGASYIVGDRIVTGKIQDITGQNFMNLTAGTFNLGDSSSGLDWSVTEDGKLTIRGAVVASMVFAEDADIQNLIVDTLKTSPDGKRIEITHDNNNQVFYDDSDNEVLRIDDNLDTGNDGTPLGGVRVMGQDIIGGNRDSVYMTGNGLFSNASGIGFTGDGQNGSIVGLLRRGNNIIGGKAGAVVGIDQSVDPGTSQNFGGIFNTLNAYTYALLSGLLLNPKQLTADHAVTDDDCFLSCANAATGLGFITITLPDPPSPGKVLLIWRRGAGGVSIDAGSIELASSGGTDTNYTMPAARMALLIYDGSYWHLTVFN